MTSLCNARTFLFQESAAGAHDRPKMLTRTKLAVLVLAEVGEVEVEDVLEQPQRPPLANLASVRRVRLARLKTCF